MEIYVSKEGKLYQTFPVPEDLDNWIKVEVEDDFSIGSQVYDVEAGEWVEDPEVLAGEIRAKRDALLEEADHLIMIAEDDLNDSLVKEIRLYRKLLRDVPQQEGFPHQVTFPDKPEGV